MNGKNIFLVLAQKQKQIQMLVFCLHPVLCAQGSEEVGKCGLSSLLCLQGAELAGRAWGWQTFPGQQPPLQAHRFHIPGQLLLAAHPACLHTGGWTGLCPLHLLWWMDHRSPWTCCRAPLCQAGVLILSQAHEGFSVLWQVIGTIPMYSGLEYSGDIT